MPAVEGFKDGDRHHDAQEWVTNLMDAVGNLLPYQLGQQWRRLFNIGITVEHVCDGPEHHRDIKEQSMKTVLSVPVMDDYEQLIYNINDAIKEELSRQWVTRTCDNCTSTTSAEYSTITSCPEVTVSEHLYIALHYTGPDHSLQAVQASPAG